MTCLCFSCCTQRIQPRKQVFFHRRSCTGLLKLHVWSRINTHRSPTSTTPRLTSVSEPVANTGQKTDTHSNFLFRSNTLHWASIKSQDWPLAHQQKLPEDTTNRGYLLPKLCDRRGEVSGIQRYPKRFVLPESVFHAGRRVPLLVAVCPWQHALERLEQVVESPGQDHDVVHVQKGHNHYGSITNSWKEGERKEKRADVTAAAPCDLLGLVPFPLHCGLVSCPTLLLMETAQPHITQTCHISGPQGSVSGYDLLTLREDCRNLPNLTLTQLFQVLLEEGKGIRLCLFAAPSHFLGTYVGNLILATMSPKPTFLAAAQLDSTCTTQLSTGWAESMWEIKKTFLEWVKKESMWKQLFCLNFTCAKEGWHLLILWLPGSTSAYSYEPQPK